MEVFPRSHPYDEDMPIRFMTLIMALVLSASFAEEPRLDTDYVFKPLVDTSQEQGNTSEHEVPVSTEPVNKPPLVLQGKVQTLQEAIVSEKDTVDWYGWYLNARNYLSRTGGLDCPLGTPIKFYRDGRIEPITVDGICRASLIGRAFPLPEATKLDALILPVRSSSAPPASPAEIYKRIQQLQQYK